VKRRGTARSPNASALRKPSCGGSSGRSVDDPPAVAVAIHSIGRRSAAARPCGVIRAEW
jgi:hypothetical protein